MPPPDRQHGIEFSANVRNCTAGGLNCNRGPRWWQIADLRVAPAAAEEIIIFPDSGLVTDKPEVTLGWRQRDESLIGSRASSYAGKERDTERDRVLGCVTTVDYVADSTNFAKWN
jgi:hypothetical protein